MNILRRTFLTMVNHLSTSTPIFITPLKKETFEERLIEFFRKSVAQKVPLFRVPLYGDNQAIANVSIVYTPDNLWHAAIAYPHYGQSSTLKRGVMARRGEILRKISHQLASQDEVTALLTAAANTKSRKATKVL